MREKKLNFRFHDPNSEADTAEYILKLFLEVDKGKVEQAIQAADFKDQAFDPSDFNDPELPAADLSDFKDDEPAAGDPEEGLNLSL